MRAAWFVAVSMLSTSAVAQPPSVGMQAPTTGSNTTNEPSWPGGVSQNGTRGAHRVEAASALPEGDLLLMLSGQYSIASDLFEAGDTNERHGQHITILWAPIEGLELWLRQSTVSNRNGNFDPATTQNLGDPTLGIKYSYPLDALGVGGGINLLIPTSAKGTGLNPSAFVLDMYAAASYRLLPWLALSVNAGYRLNNTKKIFKQPTILNIQKFTANISEHNLVLAGLGAETFFRVGEKMALAPFVELTAGIATDATDQSPIRASLGTKWLPFGEDAVELTAGADIALSGTPVAGGTMAGIPPWEGFVRLGVHITPEPEVVIQSGGAVSCSADDECASGQSCVEGTCAVVKFEKVVEKVETPVPTFHISGGVFDHSSGDPIRNATITFSGVEGSPIAVDYSTGEFKSWPIPTGDGIIQVTVNAPGYRPGKETVPKGEAGEVKTLVFKIQSTGEAATGEIRGTLKDSRSGKPVRGGQIFIPILNKRLKTGKDGAFSATVEAGRYQLLISHKRYATQNKEIEIRAGDVVILNLDMTPKR